MLLLKGIGILSLGIWFAGTQDTSLRVERAVPPIHPVNTLRTGVVVVELVFNQPTGALQTRLLHSESPFIGAALDALNRWRFAAPPAPGLYRTSVSFLFRSPVFYSMKVEAGAIRPWTPGEDCPALPQHIVDPGYPVASLATGVVILEAKVDASGTVTEVQAVNGIASLAEQAASAVKNWKFSPAMASGKPVPSNAFVVISYVLPT